MKAISSSSPSNTQMSRTNLRKSRKNSGKISKSNTQTDQNNKSGDNPCCICTSECMTNESCLGCFCCSEWLHVSCAGITDIQYNAILSLGDAVEYFCPTCRNKKKSSIPAKSCDVIQDHVISRIQHLEDTVLSLVDAVKDASKLHNITPSAIQESTNRSDSLSYSDICRKIKTHPAPIATTGKAHNTLANSQSDQGLQKTTTLAYIVKGVTNKSMVRNPSTIRENLVKYFPRLRIVKCNTTPKGFVFIQVMTDDDGKRLTKEWKSTYFGNESSVHLYNAASANIHDSVILKGVPTDLVEANILNEIKTQYDSASDVNRFQKNGNNLRTIRVTFKSDVDMNRCLTEGVFLDNYFFLPEKYIPTRFPTRCYKCNKYGHTVTLCQEKQSCSKCGTIGHTFNECTSENVKCCNCGGAHLAISRECPVFLKQFKKINFLG